MTSTISSISRGIIAVTSCKGGVGKSTVSLELAFQLVARGRKVGLYDADIYGPSLPSQLPPEVSKQQIELSEDGYSVQPIMYEGLPLMSFGWFSKLWGSRRRNATDKSQLKDDDITLRGSTIGLLAVQLLHTTRWGDLDYLIVDTPPGTGDVPQMLAKKVPLRGGVVVTTPCNLAVSDVLKGVRMLERVQVPVLAVVENMASFTCGKCSEIHYPFGRGHIEAVLSAISAPSSAPIPGITLPIVSDAACGYQGGKDCRLSPNFLQLVDAVEEACSTDPRPVTLPHELGFNELPHWPMEMEVHALGLIK